MKQLQFVFLALLSILLSACGDDDGAIGVDAGSGKVTATIDGQSWQSKDEVDGAVYVDAQGTHQIQGYHEDGSFMGMTIFGVITSGATIDGSGGEFQAQYKPDFNGSEAYSSLLSGGGGSITFTTFSNSKVKGTFEFTGVKVDATGQSEIEIKSGSFDIDL